ncbi:MAG: type II toxin-antitoxin system prevent-host-death family antitoxin [Candidatus Accumulibacter meliphilus]|jgi:prevent-host-death family protein|uniref:Type II toxin-antitoxin system prevent-host-death family antitoxin n=1 Tax=Candidatus Accumulibacter meliphilus TaxID=2211374 RepID=A0A369XUR8_9PROT|nr:MAG: type II toxin-antitoxin system prevent-host-death family antitoxin [Candidatus Accumulibacter meliphilus]
MPIAIRELKASLSRVLQRAQAGEIIEVTSHSKPIARIVGIPAHADEGLRGLIASGGLSWTGNKPRLQPPVVLVASGTAVSRIVLTDRA